MGIHLACSNDKKGDIIKYLIENGADIEAISDELGTPLTWAVASQNITGIKILLKQEKCNIFGVTNSNLPPPIIIAIDQKNSEIIELFINKNKECINQQDSLGNKCLHIASEKGDIKIVKLLLDAGASVNEKCNGKEPIKFAMQNEQWDCVAFLRNLTATKVLEEIKEEENKKQKEFDEDEFNKLSQQEKEEKAIDFKEQGNQLFLAKDYDSAIPLYLKSIQLNSKLIASYTNIAACYIQIKEPTTALEYCAKARNIDEKWLKTYFREGEAYMQMEEYGDSAASFWEGYRMEPNNKAFYEGFQKAVKLGKEKVAKEKKQ